jgi:hypothetical protein
MRALHVRTDDIDPSHYSVAGLPAGWTWAIRQDDLGGSFLSIYRNGSANAFPSGSTIAVTYTGSGQPMLAPRSVRQCGGGTGDPDDVVLSDEEGLRILTGVQSPPGRPGRPRVEVFTAAASTFSVRLAWNPAPGVGIDRYEVYDLNDGVRLGTTTQSEITLSSLSSDTLYAFSVHAVGSGHLFGPASPLALGHRDEEGALVLSATTSQVAYEGSLSSWHRPFQAWTLGLTPPQIQGTLIFSTIHHDPDPLPGALPGDRHPIWQSARSQTYSSVATRTVRDSWSSPGVPRASRTTKTTRSTKGRSATSRVTSAWCVPRTVSAPVPSSLSPETGTSSSWHEPACAKARTVKAATVSVRQRRIRAPRKRWPPVRPDGTGVS